MPSEIAAKTAIFTPFYETGLDTHIYIYLYI